MSKPGSASLVPFVLAGLCLAGCSTPEKRGFVYKEWSTRMNEMGIFTIFPPREDIVVGDVYAVPLHPYDSTTVEYIGGLGNAGIHVSYLGDTNLHWSNLLTTASNYYSTRPYPADTQTNALETGTNAPLMVGIPGFSDPSNRSSAFQPGPVARLRQVSFPDFSVSTINQAGLSAMVPIEAFMGSFQFNHSDIKAVHFKISQAESYGLTTEELLRDLVENDLIRYTPDGAYLNGSPNGVISVGGGWLALAMFRDILQTLGDNPKLKLPDDVRRHVHQELDRMTNSIYLALISEVYYARSIDITIDRKSGGSAGATVRPPTSEELGKLVQMGLTKPIPAATNSTAASSSGTNSAGVVLPELNEGDSALDLAKRIRGINTPTGVENIGGSVNVLRVTASNIGLRRVFQRPVAVGVRGVVVRVDVMNPKELNDGKGKIWLRIEPGGH